MRDVLAGAVFSLPDTSSRPVSHAIDDNPLAPAFPEGSVPGIIGIFHDDGRWTEIVDDGGILSELRYFNGRAAMHVMTARASPHTTT